MKKKEVQTVVDRCLKEFYSDLLESPEAKLFTDDVNHKLVKAYGKSVQWAFRRGFEDAMAIANKMVDRLNADRALAAMKDDSEPPQIH